MADESIFLWRYFRIPGMVQDSLLRVFPAALLPWQRTRAVAKSRQLEITQDTARNGGSLSLPGNSPTGSARGCVAPTNFGLCIGTPFPLCCGQ